MVLKKGQVTVFIIIGIILVISVGIFIYLYHAEVIRPFEEVVVPSIAKAPAEVQPIQDYVSACVEATARDALQRIGDYGGYMDGSGFLYNPFIPTEGEAVQFSRGSDLIIPYWWFLESGNDCTGECRFSSLRPELYRKSGVVSIEGQLDEFVNAHLKECLAGFEPFVAQNFEIKAVGDVETETTIAKENVFFVVKYPLRITRADQSFAINEYMAEMDVNLARIYELATDLANLEAETGVLERFTVEMVSAFSALDKDMLPPSNDFDVQFGPGIIWFKSRIAEGIQEILASYIPMLQVGNTRYYMPVEAPEGEEIRDKELYENLYNRDMLIPLEKDYTDLAASFTYLPWWNIYFDANCEGEVCMPQSVSTVLLVLQLGLHKYDFGYDISYPVLVEIRDPDAFKGEGYSFKYFMEANVRNNAPMPSVFEPLQPLELSLNSMLCDLNQRHSGNVSIFVRDARNKKGVDNALVGYTCGRESCMLGSTVNGTLITQLPRCLGGMLSASKQEYLTRFVPLDVLDNRNLNAAIVIEPYRYVDFSVKKYLLGKGSTSWSLDTNRTVIQAQDEDTIIMLRKRATRFEPVFNAFGEVCGSPSAKSPAACGSPPSENSEGIALVPGTYDVQVYSVKYPMPKIEIPPDKRSAGSGLTREEYYVPEKSIIFDAANPLPAGFADFEWNLTAKQLDSGNAVEFYFINVALDRVPKSRRKIEDLSEIGKAIDYSKLYRNILEPRVFRKSKAGGQTVTVKINE